MFVYYLFKKVLMTLGPWSRVCKCELGGAGEEKFDLQDYWLFVAGGACWDALVRCDWLYQPQRGSAVL